MDSPNKIKPCPRCGKLPPCNCSPRPEDPDHTYAKVAGATGTTKSRNKPVLAGDVTDQLERVSLLEPHGRAKQPPRRTRSYQNKTKNRARDDLIETVMDRLELTMKEASLERQARLNRTNNDREQGREKQQGASVGLSERPGSPTVPAFLDEHNRGNPRWCPLTKSTDFCLEWADHPEEHTHPDHLY